MNIILDVVPAKAGTRSHGPAIVARSEPRRIGLGLWVPAFAGTTLGESRGTL